MDLQETSGDLRLTLEAWRLPGAPCWEQPVEGEQLSAVTATPWPAGPWGLARLGGWPQCHSSLESIP